MKIAPSASLRSQEICVGINLQGTIIPVGMLIIARDPGELRDRSTGKFRYFSEYLRNPQAVPLDPVHLPLEPKESTHTKYGGLPSAIRDCAPDSWGRYLISLHYRYELGITSPLCEMDYLIASPKDRAGNLAFSSRFPPQWGNKELNPSSSATLAALQSHIEKTIAADRAGQYAPEAKLLFTGAGGARPKTSVTANGNTYMVKLPGEQDRKNSARIEAFSLDIARACGARVAPEAHVRVSGDTQAFISRRFDRDEKGHPRQVVSAATVLNADEDLSRRGWSYPLLAQEMERWSANPAADKMQLFRCMVLHAKLSDRDDHPRNYAMVRLGTKSGCTLGQWRLAPLFDLVAGQEIDMDTHAVTDLAMQIGTQGTAVSEENLCSRADAFGLTSSEAAQEIEKIEAIVQAEWLPLAAKHGLSAKDAEMIRQAITPLRDRKRWSPIDQLLNQHAVERNDRRTERET